MCELLFSLPCFVVNGRKHVVHCRIILAEPMRRFELIKVSAQSKTPIVAHYITATFPIVATLMYHVQYTVPIPAGDAVLSLGPTAKFK